MDRDRWSYLAVRAYTKGLVRFTEDERRDVRWRLREEILLAEVERELLAKLHEVVHLAESSAAQYVSQSVFDHHYDAAKQQYHSFSQLMYPFGTDDRPIDKAVFDTLSELWVREFGDPDDDGVQATIEALRNMNNDN